MRPGDIVYAHYASGNGRTVNTDLGIVAAVLDGGRVRIRLTASFSGFSVR